MVVVAPFVLAIAALTSATPLGSLAKRQAGGEYTCNDDCAKAKQALKNAGADDFDIAVAIQETGATFKAPSGAPGLGKTGDSANFSLFNLNWCMIRNYCSQFKGQTADQWMNGAVLNNDNAAATRCINEQRRGVGTDDAWLHSERWGCNKQQETAASTGNSGGQPKQILPKAKAAIPKKGKQQVRPKTQQKVQPKAQAATNTGQRITPADDYSSGINYIKNYIDQGHMTDNKVTSYSVGGI